MARPWDFVCPPCPQFCTIRRDHLEASTLRLPTWRTPRLNLGLACDHRLKDGSQEMAYPLYWRFIAAKQTPTPRGSYS